MTVASTGLPGKRLRQEEIDYMSSTIHPASHAGYYPDAMPMSIKITFDKRREDCTAGKSSVTTEWTNGLTNSRLSSNTRERSTT